MTTLADLELLFRSRTGDTAKPYGSGSAEVWAWLNEAEREACTRADLLFEDADTDLTEIAVTAGTASYSIDSRWARITYAAFLATDSESDPIELAIYLDPRKLAGDKPTFRTDTAEPQRLLVQEARVRFDCLPATGGTLILEGFRLPLADMTAGDSEPEIQSRHHEQLVEWAVMRHNQKPDSEFSDPQRAAAAQEQFTHYFGARPDKDARQEHEVPVNNIAFP